MRISPKQYAQTLYDLTEGKEKNEIEKSIREFAMYLAKNRKLKLSDKIIEQFSRIYNSKKGIVEAEVVSRKKMDETEMKKIKYFVKEKYQAKEIVLNNIIDQNIQGGIILKVGDEVLDSSIAGRLAELEKVLIN